MRLVREVHNMRSTAAASLAVSNKSSSNLFLQVAVAAFQSDLLIRLIRVLERDPKVASFWYLFQLDPMRVGRGIDVKRLKKLSERLKKIRNKVFVHIDRDAVFDPQRVYSDAGILGAEIREAIDALWLVSRRLYKEQTGRDFSGTSDRLDDLAKDFRRDFEKPKT